MSVVKNALKSKAPQITPDYLLKGIQIAEKNKQIRTSLINKAQEVGKKVDGSKIVSEIKEWAVRAKRANPTSTTSIDKFVNGATKSYKGKNITAETAKNLWDDAYKGFSDAGTKGSTIEAGYHNAVRNILRKELDKIAPGFEKTTKGIKKGLDLEDLLKPVRESTKRSEIREGLKEIPSPLMDILKKIVVPTAVGAGVGVPISVALYKILGQKRN